MMYYLLIFFSMDVKKKYKEIILRNNIQIIHLYAFIQFMHCPQNQLEYATPFFNSTFQMLL